MFTVQNLRRNAGVVGVGFLLLLIHTALGGQLLHPTEPMPSFEVATIRPWQPPSSAVSTVAPGSLRKFVPGSTMPAVKDRVHFIGQAELLIAAAYGIPVFSTGARIISGPDWIRSESDRYELTGKIDDAQFAAIQKMSPMKQQEQVSLMEQTLLAERFKLKVHFETREMPRYDLVLAKGASKLVRSQEGTTSRLSFVGPGQGCEVEATATGVPLGELARSPFLRSGKREVVDETGVAGRFDFTLKFRSPNCVAGEGTGADNSDVPDLFTALQEQLGLKLVPDSGPVEVVVIDHIERPSEN